MRIRHLIITTICIAIQTQLLCEEQNFLLYDLNEEKWLCEEGPYCDERFSPCSSFKIPLSVMGFDSGILQNEFSPRWPFVEGYVENLDKWKQPHTPSLWMRNSCVWFSQVLTTMLGMRQFAQYIQLFDYGNMDLTGDKGKFNGLTNAWLESSLKISPREQIFFLGKLVRGTLPVSHNAMEMSKRILFLEEINGWKLYGKTGSGNHMGVKQGWFIGWIEKNDQPVLFVNYMRFDEPVEGYGGPIAKQRTLEFLRDFIQESNVANASASICEGK